MKSINHMIKEEINKQIFEKLNSNLFTELVENVYNANMLVTQLSEKNSPTLYRATKSLRLAETKLHEFFENERDLNIGSKTDINVSGEVIEPDNSHIYDSLLCVMDCAKELYMNINIDDTVNTMVITKIQQAEELIRLAAEVYKISSIEKQKIEDEELSNTYIVSGDDDECLDCDNDTSF